MLGAFSLAIIATIMYLVMRDRRRRNVMRDFARLHSLAFSPSLKELPENGTGEVLPLARPYPYVQNVNVCQGIIDSTEVLICDQLDRSNRRPNRVTAIVAKIPNKRFPFLWVEPLASWDLLGRFFNKVANRASDNHLKYKELDGYALFFSGSERTFVDYFRSKVRPLLQREKGLSIKMDYDMICTYKKNKLQDSKELRALLTRTLDIARSI